MALNLSKLFGRGSETRLEGGKEGLATGSHVLDEHSDQPESIVILDNDGETEVARIAGEFEPLGLDRSSPKLERSGIAGAETGAEGQSLYFEDSVRTAREAMGSTRTSPAEPLSLERDTNQQGAVDIWEHAATAPRPDSVTEDMAEIVLAATGGLDGPETAIVDAADYTIWRNTLDSTTDLRADGNGNNMIDQGDYQVWKANFGAQFGGGAADGSPAAVPEPSCAVLIAFAVARLFLARGRRIS